MEGINSDKVNINLGGADGGGGGAGLAAVIAALGNRNQGNDNAALIAALGNRNDDSSNVMAPLMAAMTAGNMGRRDEGMGGMWPLLLLALLGRGGRGGLFGGGGDDCGNGGAETRITDSVANTSILTKLGAIEAAIPYNEAQVQLALAGVKDALTAQATTNFNATTLATSNVKDTVQNSLLAQLTATAGVKDAVQTAFTVLNQNILDQGCKGREATQASTTAILSKLDQNEIDRLRHERDTALRTVEVNALRSQVEVNQTVNTTQAQAQGQFQSQRQSQDIRDELRDLRHAIIVGNQVLQARQGQDVINFGGTMTASGTQAAANTQVR